MTLKLLGQNNEILPVFRKPNILGFTDDKNFNRSRVAKFVVLYGTFFRNRNFLFRKTKLEAIFFIPCVKIKLLITLTT